MPIYRPAYMEFFPEHGHPTVHPRICRIIFPDGGTSSWFVTKAHAYRGIETYFEIPLTPEEILFLKEEVSKREMIRADSSLEEMYDCHQGELNELLRKLEKSLQDFLRRDKEGEEWKDG